jgi:predicted nucleic acid-binding protein
MSGLVVDASVALKWYVAEADSGLADGILQQSIELHAPELLKAELANGLWKNRRKNLIDDEQARLAVLNVARSVNRWHACDPFLTEALRLAAAMNHPIYDFIYPCLARELNIPCVTADRRLLDKLSGTPLAAHVIHLADWRP